MNPFAFPNSEQSPISTGPTGSLSWVKSIRELLDPIAHRPPGQIFSTFLRLLSDSLWHQAFFFCNSGELHHALTDGFSMHNLP